MRIAFRTDATTKIGTGHLMRCLTLAHELEKRGAEIEFVCRKLIDSLANIIISNGYKLHILPDGKKSNDDKVKHADWLEGHWQEDATQTLLKVKGANWLVVDHYALDEKWESIVHPHVDKIMVIDDIADRPHNCDLLLDQNYYLDAEKRYAKLVDNKCELLLTPKYALLREEFAYARARLNRDNKLPQRVLISFGGVDANNDTSKAIEALQSFKGEVIVVAGGANQNYAELEKLCAERKNFRLFKTVDNIAELMSKTDIAIGGGGVTSWERASLGLPALAWPIADNQIKILADLEKTGAVKLTTPETLEKDLKTMKTEVIKDMSEKAMQLCDAEGAIRVANKIWSMA